MIKMKYNIHGDKMEITEAIKEHINQKLSKLENYFNNPEDLEARVITKVHSHNQKVEVTIPANGFTLRAEESNPDLYAAIYLVINKLERQIRKNKTRIQKHLKDESIKELNLEFEELDDDAKNKIVKRKVLENKPMDVEEAILEMNLLGHDFYIFNDSETNKVSVIYKRKDGNYGLIETK